MSLTLAVAAITQAQTNCVRHEEPTGGFTYCPPSGWVPKDPARGPYKTFSAPSTTAIRGANFNVKEDPSTQLHKQYVDASVRTVSDSGSTQANAKTLVSRTPFATVSKIRGTRLVFEWSLQGVAVRSVQYVFDLPGKKLIITGTARAGDANVTDPIFDGVASSLKLGTP